MKPSGSAQQARRDRPLEARSPGSPVRKKKKQKNYKSPASKYLILLHNLAHLHILSPETAC